MDDTPNLRLPYIAAAQAQKHVTPNEAIRVLDAIVQVGVLARNLSAPPPTPANGDRYIVAAGATEAWAGRSSQIAALQDGAWMFYVPREGWLAWIADEDVLVAWNGSTWVTAGGDGGGSVNPVELVGVNATADATNRLAVKSDATLFSHDDVTPGSGDMRQVLNKAAAGNTVSQLYQSNWSGRAETGLAGDDDFHVKVSPDGATWFEALVADRTTGRVRLPNTLMREMLSADRTYYVATTGSDANSGLTAGAPLATISAAVAKAIAVDPNGHAVTIQIADGTYTGAAGSFVVPRPQFDGSRLVITGNATTPGNVVLAGPGVVVSGGARVDLRNMRLQTATSGVSLLSASARADVRLANIEWGACTASHIEGSAGAQITKTGNDTILAAASGVAAHINLRGGALFAVSYVTTTLVGTPHFSWTFLGAISGAICDLWGWTFSGGATGARCSLQLNSVVNTNGGGTGYFPGDAAEYIITGAPYQ
ncbi:MAG: DUF2793 domain-containing protein [Hyphomicrobiaceae bacterium]